MLARSMRLELSHPEAGAVPSVGSPLKRSLTPVHHERPPPLLGQHTREVLGEVLGLDATAIETLRDEGAIA